MARFIIFAVLVAVPVSLVTWVFAKGADVQCESCNPATICKKKTEGAAHAPPPPSKAANKPAPKAKVVVKAEKAKPAHGEDTALMKLLAEPLKGFSVKGDVERYDRKTLFDYINGGAPLYLKKNFRKLAAAELGVEGGGELTCDVYDMSTDADATAMYASEAQPTAKAVEIGAGGHVSTMSLVFHKGPYYVKLTAFDDAAEAALPKLAKAISERVP